MFTPDSLLDIALEQDAIIAGMGAHVPGTYHGEHYAARQRRDKALKAAEHMQAHGIVSAAHIGEFQSFQVREGDVVRLRKGATVFSTSRQVPRDGKPNGVNRKIRVRSVHQGYIDYSGMSQGEVRNPTVHWAGTGSYWYWTDINNVELI
jgi:hypothetical protein